MVPTRYNPTRKHTSNPVLISLTESSVEARYKASKVTLIEIDPLKAPISYVPEDSVEIWVQCSGV